MKRSRSSVILAGAAGALFLVGALSGCGGSTPTAEELTKETFSQASFAKIRTGNSTLSVNASGTNIDALKQPISLKLSGPFEVSANGQMPKFDQDLTVSASGMSFSGGLMYTGTEAFVSFQNQNFKVSNEMVEYLTGLMKQASAQDKDPAVTDQAKKLLAGMDPASWFGNQKLGKDTEVAGVETYNVTAGVNMQQMANDFSQMIMGMSSMPGMATGKMPGMTGKDAQAEMQKGVKQFGHMMTTALHDVTVEYWTGKEDRLLRQVVVKGQFVNPSNSSQTGQFDLTLSLANLNQPVNIAPPQGAKSLDALLSPMGFTEKKLLDLLKAGGIAGDAASGSTEMPGDTTKMPGESASGADGSTTQAGKGDSTTTGGESAAPPSKDDNRQTLECLKNARSDQDAAKCLQGLEK